MQDMRKGSAVLGKERRHFPPPRRVLRGRGAGQGPHPTGAGAPTWIVGGVGSAADPPHRAREWPAGKRAWRADPLPNRRRPLRECLRALGPPSGRPTEPGLPLGTLSGISQSPHPGRDPIGYPRANYSRTPIPRARGQWRRARWPMPRLEWDPASLLHQHRPGVAEPGWGSLGASTSGTRTGEAGAAQMDNLQDLWEERD